MYNKFIKRLLDFLIAVLATVVLLIPMLIVAAIIKIEDPGPALFKQKRVGANKQYFQILKFRSMKTETPDVPTHLLENPEQYITKTGRFIRKYSIDELPQLLNIIKGDMAIVGPRPALWNQFDLIEERDKYGANDIRPGLTGLAQISGRDELEISEKARLDGVYTEKLSFLTDAKCILKSVAKVLTHEGVVEGSV